MTSNIRKGKCQTLGTLDIVVNNELNNVCHWLNANKLTINAKKSNFVIFRPAQKRINHQPCIRIPDNNYKFYIIINSHKLYIHVSVRLLAIKSSQ